MRSGDLGDDGDGLSAAAIHPSAVVAGSAKLAENVEIGPFCHVGPEVELAEGVRLLSHVVVAGRTRLGARTRVFPFASLGHEPQDLKYRGEPVTLTVGPDCTIREGVTMNPGTAGHRSATVVGARSTFLANSHVAHDCIVGDDVIFSNNVMLAGHCDVGDFAILSGGVGVHQFVRIGAHAFVGGLSGIANDVIPYGFAFGPRASLVGLNVVGVKRRGLTKEEQHELRRAYKMLFFSGGTLRERIERVGEAFAGQAQAQEIVAFLRAGGDRSVCTPAAGAGDAD